MVQSLVEGVDALPAYACIDRRFGPTDQLPAPPPALHTNDVSHWLMCALTVPCRFLDPAVLDQGEGHGGTEAAGIGCA